MQHLDPLKPRPLRSYLVGWPAVKTAKPEITDVINPIECILNCVRKKWRVMKRMEGAIFGRTLVEDDWVDKWVYVPMEIKPHWGRGWSSGWPWGSQIKPRSISLGVSSTVSFGYLLQLGRASCRIEMLPSTYLASKKLQLQTQGQQHCQISKRFHYTSEALYWHLEPHFTFDIVLIQREILINLSLYPITTSTESWIRYYLTKNVAPPNY